MAKRKKVTRSKKEQELLELFAFAIGVCLVIFAFSTIALVVSASN